MASQVELTPCGAMFDIFKRAAHLSHIELCGLVLSSRPLADGRSPPRRAADRSWVSRFIVRAPVGTLQQRYFAEYGTSAARIMSQLALRQRNPMDSTAVINMVCGPAGEPMVRALEECHQDTNLYRNALDRLSQARTIRGRAGVVCRRRLFVGCAVLGELCHRLRARDLWRRHLHAAFAWHVDARGRTRTRPGAPLGLAARTKQFCRERPALDSAERAGC